MPRKKKKHLHLKDDWINGRLYGMDFVWPALLARDNLKGKTHNQVSIIIEHFFDIEKLTLTHTKRILKSANQKTKRIINTATSLKSMLGKDTHSSLLILMIFYSPSLKLFSRFHNIKELIASLILYEISENNILAAYKHALLLKDEIYIKNKINILKPFKKFIDIGKKLDDNLSSAREISAVNRNISSYAKISLWQQMAKDKWLENPGWTVEHMAKYIEKEINHTSKASYIKKQLRGIKTLLFKRK